MSSPTIILRLFLQNFLHGFDVKTFLRDVLGFRIGLVDRQEALRITLRAAGDGLFIRLAILQEFLRITARARHDVVAIGFSLVAQTLAVGTGALHVVESIDDLLRRVDLQQLDVVDNDARLVFVDNTLHQDFGLAFNLATCFGQGALDLRAADDFAHRAFGDFFQRGFRVNDFEQVIARIAHAPQDNEFDIDDVFIAGQHQAFFGDTLVTVTAETNFEAAVEGNIKLFDALYRPRQVIAKTGFAARRCPFAKGQHHGVFPGVHAVKAAAQPEQRQHGEGEQESLVRFDRARHAAASAAFAAAATETFLRLTQHVVDIGAAVATVAAARRTLSPRVVAAAVSAA